MVALAVAYVACVGAIAFAAWIGPQLEELALREAGDASTAQEREDCAACAEETKKVCGSGACRFGQWGCCDSAFCDAVDRSLVRRNIVISQPGLHGLPFMGPEGCVVPAHLRPLCSLYSCNTVDVSRLPVEGVSEEEAERFEQTYWRARRGGFVAKLYEETSTAKATALPIAGDYVECWVPATPRPVKDEEGICLPRAGRTQ